MTVPTAEEIRRQVEARVAEEEAAYGTGAKEAPGKEETSRAFRFVPAGDLVGKPCPPRWIIDGYLEDATLACLFGPSGGMKSFVGLDMGLCVATGREWHGYAVPNPGPVFYVCGEGFAGINKRLRVWASDSDVDASTLPFFVSNQPVGILETGAVQVAVNAIRELAEAHGSPRLLIVDTLARNFGPGDENSTQDMSAFVAALDDVRAGLGCAVLVIHHTGLSATERARGASAFRAALDWEFRLELKGDTRLLSCTKAKDHEPPHDMAFEPEILDTGWTDEDGRAVTSVVLRRVEAKSPGKYDKPLKGANKIAYEALVFACTKGDVLQAYAIPVDIEAWRSEAYSRSISPSQEQGAKQRAFNRAVTFLRDAAHVSVEAEKFWPSSLPKRTQTPQTYPDKARQMSGHYPDRQDNNLKGCLDCLGADDLEQGVLA